MKILKFYADWCAPCRALTTVLDGGNVETEAVNIELNADLTIQHNVRKVPTLVFLDEEGKEAARLSGMITLEQVKEKINGINPN